MRTLRFGVTALLLTLYSASLGIGSAAAVEVVTTTPAIDGTVAVSPNFVSVTADQELLDFGNQLMVISPSNERVDDGLLTVSGNTLSVGLLGLTESGKYRVEYELLAAEESPLFGNFSFTFQAPPVVSEESPSANPADGGTDQDGKEIGSKTTDYIVIALLVLAFFILMWLARFARNTFRKE